MKSACRILLLLLFLLLAGTASSQVKAYDTYPWLVEANTNLNVRVKAGTEYAKMGTITKGTRFEALAQAQGHWVEVSYYGQRGFVCSDHITFIESRVQADEYRYQRRPPFITFGGILRTVWKIFKTLLIIAIILIAIAYKQEVLQLVMTIVVSTLICRYLSLLIFHEVTWGTNIGFVLGIILGVRRIAEDLSFVGGPVAQILGIGYYVISFPLLVLNRAQHFLSEPWRYFFKTDWPDEDAKNAIRIVLDVLQVIMYILITPLRFLNSVLYNIFVHGLSEMYDLIYEVFVPCDWDEGKGDFWQWLLYFPVRLVKYPIYHGGMMLLECFAWTVIEIFVPTVTMYHGTNLAAAESICGSADRNSYLKLNQDWRAECFTTGAAAWGGFGIYFTPRRPVARSYSVRALGSSADVPVFIAVRVSLGRIINYSLTPHFVYRQTGYGGKHSFLNAYGMQHGYVTGEWWNAGGGYWEYCMFDWQNKYNYPWRIRPLYIFNCNYNNIQHIPGGMAHWSFKTNHK